MLRRKIEENFAANVIWNLIQFVCNWTQEKTFFWLCKIDGMWVGAQFPFHTFSRLKQSELIKSCSACAPCVSKQFRFRFSQLDASHFVLIIPKTPRMRDCSPSISDFESHNEKLKNHFSYSFYIFSNTLLFEALRNVSAAATKYMLHEKTWKCSSDSDDECLTLNNLWDNWLMLLLSSFWDILKIIQKV